MLGGFHVFPWESMSMLANLSIRARLRLLALILIAGNLVIAATIWVHVGKFADDFSACSQVATSNERHGLMIERDGNDVSRATRYVSPGEDAGSNIQRLGKLETSIKGHVDAMIAVTVLVMVIGPILFFVISQGITRPVALLESTIREIEAGSDLRQRVKYDAADEMGRVSRSLNGMLGTFQDIMVRVSSSANALTQTSRVVAATTDQLLKSTHQQEAEIGQVAAAMHEMAASIQEVAQNARHAAENTTTVEAQAMGGRAVVDKSAHAIQALAGEIEQAAVVIHRLEDDGNRIGMVVEVIRGIAEQTNLLALNAAIEAARAGEQGRGFAVVADEVRNLASKTQASTQDIQSMIEALQQRTREASSVMQAGQGRARESVIQAVQAGEALDHITQAIKRINDMNGQIAHATVQQSEVAEDISRSVGNISSLAQLATQEGKQAVGNSTELQKYADNLQGLVRQFRV